MSISKAHKFFIYLMAGFIILSVIAAGFPGKLSATESSLTADSSVKEPLEMIDREITYPAELDLPSVVEQDKENKVVVKHVIHMLKKDLENQIPLTPAKNDQPFSVKEDKSKVNISLDLNSAKNQDNFNPTDLLLNSVVQNTYSVHSEDYGTFPIRNNYRVYTAAFSPRSGYDLLRFSHANAIIYFNPVKPLSVTGKVYKDAIKYENIYPDTDLYYQLEQFRLKEDIIVQKYTGQSDFYFQLSVNNAVYNVMPNGTILFSEPDTGKPLFYMARPYALDGNGDRCDAVFLTMSPDGSLKLTIDPEWLKKAIYPIIIDPTIYLAGSETYQASAGFSSIQGQNNWYYEGQNQTNFQYYLLPIFYGPPQNYWVNGNEDTPSVGSNWQFPSWDNAVRTWRAPHQGIVSIKGNVNLVVNGGDGVNVKIVKNGTQVWPASGWQYIANTVGVNVDIIVAVNTGDNIRFVVNRYSGLYADKTFWDPVITYQPEPGMDCYGKEAYWNYSSASLGGGWDASINTYNLNLILSKALFFIPGRGLSIGDNITYNSIDNRNGPLGIGWHLGSNASLVENADGSVSYTEGDGSVHVFTPNGSGGYNAPAGIYLTLQKTSPGNFTITDKKQNVYTFQNGKPTTAVDRDNNTTTFTYDGNGRLYQLSDPSVRKLTYTYNAAGQLSSVSDPDSPSHVYQFGYQNGYLTTITDPANDTVTLIYDTNGRLSSFRDPLNRVTSFTCTPEGKLQLYRDARTSGTDIYETSFQKTIQDATIITTVTDPGNHTSTFYHNASTGNLTKLIDPMNNSWQYGWSSNNLTSVQDARGTITYEYDSKGIITKVTKTVDSDPNNNIVQTMTYDSYNQLLEVVDGGGKKSSYKYSNMGNLLSTANPDLKESNGRKYDQYGNVLEYSPSVSGNYYMLKNGSMEIAGTGGELLAYWTHVPGGATATLEGFNSHGNSALKISSSTLTTDVFYQRANISYDSYATLRADVKLDNVKSSGGNAGAMIKLLYSNGESEGYYCTGSGTVPLVLTSRHHLNIVDVYIGLYNASGTAWFDGVQLELGLQSFTLSAFNSIENSEFNNLDFWHYNGATPVITTETSWGESASLKVTLPTSGMFTIYQDVPVYGGEQLTLSGMVKTSGVVGTGAYYKIDYYDAQDQIISGSTVQTGYVTETQDWARLSGLANAPAGAKYGRVTAILDGSGTIYFDSVKLVPRNSEKYIYNTAGNYVLTYEDAQGKQNNMTYNENIGTEISFKDALNNTTSYGYDSLNRLVQVTDPYSYNSYYGYDGVSNLTATRDPRSSGSSDNTYRTLFVQDNLNQLSILTDPLNRNISNTYDRCGSLIKTTLPNGLEVNYTYDSAHRLIKKTLDGGRFFNYTYDGANNLIGVTDQDNKTYTWDYDGAARLKYSADTFGNHIDYQWDKSNNLTSLSIPNTYSLHYGYGYDNKLLSVDLPDGYIAYYYDENGRVFGTRYPGGYNRNISYLPNGWCQKIQDPAFPGQYSFYYTYLDNGNISSINSWAGTENFNYDNNGRLTWWSYSPRIGSPVQESYQYDAAGNLLTKGSRTFIYNSANQITSDGNYNYIYDNNGNLTNDGTYNYIYDAENRLTQLKKVSDNSVVASYTYDFNGLRKSKTVNGQTTNFNWDASGRLVRESDSTGNTIAIYYHDTNGKFVGFKKNNQTYIYHDNQRRDIVSVTDYTGNIVAQYHYDPWGKQVSYTGTLTQPFRYAGYYYDEETGLYYLKSRYYSPALGRFLTKDSIGFINPKNPQTLNLYSYCGNNPVNRTDPNGNLDYDENGFDDDTVLNNILSPDDKKAISDQQAIWWNPKSTDDQRETAHKASLQIRQNAVARFENGMSSSTSENRNLTDRLMNGIEEGCKDVGQGYSTAKAVARVGMSFAASYSMAAGGELITTGVIGTACSEVLIPAAAALWTGYTIYEFGKGFYRGWENYGR